MRMADAAKPIKRVISATIGAATRFPSTLEGIDQRVFHRVGPAEVFDEHRFMIGVLFVANDPPFNAAADARH